MRIFSTQPERKVNIASAAPQILLASERRGQSRLFTLEFTSFALDPSDDALAAGNHANEFDSIALRERTFAPFPLMEGGGIVLD
jgi:hypothetical protein